MSVGFGELLKWDARLASLVRGDGQGEDKGRILLIFIRSFYKILEIHSRSHIRVPL